MKQELCIDHTVHFVQDFLQFLVVYDLDRHKIISRISWITIIYHHRCIPGYQQNEINYIWHIQ